MKPSPLQIEFEKLERRLDAANDQIAELQAQRSKARAEVAILSARLVANDGAPWRRQALYWEGRFSVLRHENNTLRRKLYHQEKAQPLPASLPSENLREDHPEGG